MKITEIHLKDFLHFKKNLQLDLTYPKGHNLAGKPLSKICFLGQSGTGKTTILNLIKHFVSQGKSTYTGFDEHRLQHDAVEIFFSVKDEKFSQISSTGKTNFIYKDCLRPGHPTIDEAYFDKIFQTSTQECRPILINFPFNIVKAEKNLEPKSLILRNNLKFQPSEGDLESNYILDKKIWDFTETDLKHIWDLVFDAIEKYLNKYETKKLESLDELRALSQKSTKSAQIFKNLAKWELDNPNPIEKIATECLNPILNKFSLEVETDLSKYRTEIKDRNFIIIKNQTNGEEIQYPFLSTGTQQVMLTAIPLFFIEPKNTIILFDQPETSLYPNVQYLLPETYNAIAPNDNQFFYATHSPIVASSFDPWEIVELDFDANSGYVYRKEYFKHERHIDNYFINPKLLRWDSSYKLLFDLNHPSNEERTSKLMELGILERKVAKEEDPNKKNELYKIYKNLAEQLDWPTLNAQIN